METSCVVWFCLLILSVPEVIMLFPADDEVNVQARAGLHVIFYALVMWGCSFFWGEGTFGMMGFRVVWGIAFVVVVISLWFLFLSSALKYLYNRGRLSKFIKAIWRR